MLFAALVIATAVAGSSGAAAPPDGTYNYSITSGNDTVGKSSVSVKRTGDGVALHETETLGALSFVVDETLDPATLSPKTYVATYSKDTYSQTAHVSFDRSGATVSLDGISGSSTLSNPAGIKQAYVLELAIMTGFLMLPAQIHATQATQFSGLVPSRVLQFVGRIDSSQGASRPSGVPATDLPLSVTAAVNFDEWYDPTTFVLHAVSVPSQNYLIKLVK